jgi:cyclopropane fatty-acyl-phospholipid synthase-like methyltransferase
MEGGSREKIQSEEYKIPYHYRDLFAPGQGIERKSLFNLVLGLLNLNEGARILDIGCEWARAFNPESDFYCGDIGEIEIGRYDGAACLEVIEHISDNELPIFMKSILRLLNRDGRAVFSVPTLNQPLSSKHYRHYNEDLLRDFLSSYFDNISIVGHAKSNSILYPLNSALNLISCLFYSETLQWKYPNLIKKVTRLKNKVWYKYFHEDIPSRCNRLIAVCTHKKRQ